jgi:hypothetical protein
MPINPQLFAKALPHPGNPSKQAVECLGHFFIQQLKLGKVSDEKLAILIHANRARLAAANAAGPIPNLVITQKDLEDFKRSFGVDARDGEGEADGKGRADLKQGEDLIPDLEYLLARETDLRGSQKFLQLTSRLGFNLEIFTTFEARALAALSRKGISHPSKAQYEAELGQLQATMRDEYSTPDFLENYGYVNPVPNTPTLKLFIDKDKSVSFEYPTQAVIVAGPAPAAGAGLGLEEVSAHNERIRKRIRYYDTLAQFGLNKSGKPAAVAEPFGASQQAASQVPTENYTDNSNVLGTYYNVKPVHPANGESNITLEQGLENIFSFVTSIISMILEKFMGASKKKEISDKNANPYSPLEDKQLDVPDADLFEEYRLMLRHEPTRNSLIAAWKKAEKSPSDRKIVMAKLKNALAMAGLNEELNSLNFNLLLNNLERNPTYRAAVNGDPAYTREHLQSLWREGPEQQKQAMMSLHKHMATVGCYLEMNESLKTMEYTARDTGLLADPKLVAVKKSYKDILSSLHTFPLHEASAEFQKSSSEMRHAMLAAIDRVENKLKADRSAFEKASSEQTAADASYKQKKEKLDAFDKQTAKDDKDIAEVAAAKLTRIGRYRAKIILEVATAEHTKDDAKARFELSQTAYQTARTNCVGDLQHEFGGITKGYQDSRNAEMNEITLKQRNAAQFAAEQQRLRLENVASGFSTGASGGSYDDSLVARGRPPILPSFGSAGRGVAAAPAAAPSKPKLHRTLSH